MSINRKIQKVYVDSIIWFKIWNVWCSRWSDYILKLSQSKDICESAYSSRSVKTFFFFVRLKIDNVAIDEALIRKCLLFCSISNK